MVLTSFALEGPACSGKTNRLIQHAVALYHRVPVSQVLILCSNYYRKARFLECVQEHLHGGYGQLQVTTFSALVRNSLSLYWPLAEARITQTGKLGGKPVIFPELSGFEASEYIMQQVLRQYRLQKPDAFCAFKGSEQSLIKQLIRRLRLRAENGLSRQTMMERSVMIMEPCLAETEAVLRQFDSWSFALRVLDNSKQIEVFQQLLQHDNALSQYFRQTIRHVVVDDVAETIPAQQHFLKWLAPQCQTMALAADIDGGTRRGYLNAYPYDWPGLKQLKQMETIVLHRSDAMFAMGQQLMQRWTEPLADWEKLPPMPANTPALWRANTLNRVDMLDAAVTETLRLLNPTLSDAPLKPADIAIVLPRVDALARLYLQNAFQKHGLAMQVLTGTERPTDNGVCRALLALLQLANWQAWQLPLSALEFQGVLRYGLKLHQLDAAGTLQVVAQYRQHSWNQPMALLPPSTLLNEPAAVRYEQLRTWLHSVASLPITEQIYSALSHLLSPYLTAADDLSDMQQLIRSLYIQDIAQQVHQFGHVTHAGREWFMQVKTGMVSDTPNKPEAVRTDAIVLGTPQKIIDFEIERDVQLWLDVNSREWSRTDHAPLYNAWVHSVNWAGEQNAASEAFNQQLAQVRAAHITRTLALYARKQVQWFASEYDEMGNPQTGLFAMLLQVDSPQDVKQLPVRASLRADQAPVLNYQSGPMAITAVPGAGKTFINVELILEFLSRGLAGKHILVLTCMDSAAKTLLSRLKQKTFGAAWNLPIVCTIHSLAFRMITEADHAVYLGLDPDAIQVLDTYQETALMQSILNQLDGGEDGFFRSPETVLRTIQSLRVQGVSPQEYLQRCQNKAIPGGRLLRFQQVYEAYEHTLKQQGLLDFTQMILLAIQLLEQYPDVRQVYQQRFEVVIEDEAQDSSALLQRFLSLLTAQHRCLIRTGDPNQSIMSFSAADPSVFRNFIREAEQTGCVVRMTQSGRCAPEIMTLANQLIQWTQTQPGLQEAFESNWMAPTSHNPSLLQPLEAITYSTSDEEQQALVFRIQTLHQQHPGKSTAVLVRGNAEVLQMTEALQRENIKAISYSESTILHPAFVLLCQAIAVLQNPLDVESTRQFLQALQAVWQLPSDAVTPWLDSPPNLMILPPVLTGPEWLQHVYYHLQDASRFAYGQDMCRLMVTLSDRLLRTPSQRSLGYLCALKAQDWASEHVQTGDLRYSCLEWVAQRLEVCLNKKMLPFKAPQELLDTGHAETTENFVHVMTLHKAKGQEFDFVFLPNLTQTAFPAVVQDVMWREQDKLMTEIEQLCSADTHISLEERTYFKKQAKVHEEARLLYVGLTRAKRGLFLSCATEGLDYRGKKRKQSSSAYFEALQAFMKPSSNTSTVEVSHAL